MFSFKNLSSVPGLHHGVTTRAGGVSEGHYAALNLGFHVGDDPEIVRENRRLAGAQLGYDPKSLVAAQQVHADAAARVSRSDAGRGAFAWEDAIPAADALLTSERRLPLLIQVADCAPILLAGGADLAVVHAGWRGALAGIAGKTAEQLGTVPATIFAGIGPCLCPNCLEVGPEVAAAVEQVDYQAVLPGSAKPHLDLRGLIARDLRRAGVPKANIEVMDRCPRCEPDTFFSHRAQGGSAGRFGLVAWWE